jgi:hypothetical protein
MLSPKPTMATNVWVQKWLLELDERWLTLDENMSQYL